MEVQVRREDCVALNKQSFGSNANQFPDMCNVMQICAAPAFWFRYDRWQCDGEKLPTFSACGIPEIVDRKPQLIDSILEACQQCRGIRNAFENNASAIATLSRLGNNSDVLITEGSQKREEKLTL